MLTKVIKIVQFIYQSIFRIINRMNLYLKKMLILLEIYSTEDMWRTVHNISFKYDTMQNYTHIIVRRYNSCRKSNHMQEKF